MKDAATNPSSPSLQTPQTDLQTANTPGPPAVKPQPPLTPTQKVKSRPRPRRRIVTSDAESDDEVASITSVSDHSASEHSDDDSEDEDAVEDVVDLPSPEPEKPVFADAASITPAAWADETVKGEVAEMSFEEFNRGESGRGKGIGRGRGKGGAVGQRREFTEEEKRRFEESKAKRKEKQKAKKAELKEAKKREGATASTTAPAESSSHTDKAPLTSSKPDKVVESNRKPDKGKQPKAKGKKLVSVTYRSLLITSPARLYPLSPLLLLH